MVYNQSVAHGHHRPEVAAGLKRHAMVGRYVQSGSPRCMASPSALLSGISAANQCAINRKTSNGERDAFPG